MQLSEDIILVDGRAQPSEDTIFVGDHLDPFCQFETPYLISLIIIYF